MTALYYAAGVRPDVNALRSRIDTVVVRRAATPLNTSAACAARWAVSAAATTRMDSYPLECIEALYGPSAMLYGEDRIVGMANIWLVNARLPQHGARSGH